MENQPDSSENRAYHQPVMLSECLEALRIRPDGTYIDVTFGGGGHSMAILEKLTTGHLIALDQDEDAAGQAARIQSRSFTFCKANFRNLREVLQQHHIPPADGILADLGVSSHQFDAAHRGFSIRNDGPLDMRMDSSASLTAADVLNNASAGELHRMLGMYGEIRNARTAAARIVERRPVTTTFGLKSALSDLAPRGKENKWFAQVFQALRIEVNQELKALEDFLIQSPAVVKPGGRLVILSYHSLEDRMVKNFISSGKVFGQVEKDLYGNLIRPFEPVYRKALVADPDEISRNGRARSARLRAGERTPLPSE